MSKQPRQHDEDLARRRVEESPLRFFISRYNGNNPSSQNSIERPDNFVRDIRKSGDQIHTIGRDE